MEQEAQSLPAFDRGYWLKRWEDKNTPWNKEMVDPVLEKHVDLLTGGDNGLSVLVTMCGKSVDLKWLCSRGHSVTGVELSPLAVEQFFKENSIPHTVTESGEFSVYSATDRSLKMYCGDVLKFGPSVGGVFDAIWDCKAIPGINAEDRMKYRDMLVSVLKPNRCILMASWHYEQSIHQRPPFSLPYEMISDLFAPYCDAEEVESIDMAGSAFCQNHDLPWAKRPVVLLKKK